MYGIQLYCDVLSLFLSSHSIYLIKVVVPFQQFQYTFVTQVTMQATTYATQSCAHMYIHASRLPLRWRAVARTLKYEAT